MTRNLSRLSVFELTIFGALALIGWVAYRLFEIVPQAEVNRKPLIELKQEYQQISENVQGTINELDNTLTHFLQAKDHAEMEHFEKKAAEWQRWLEKEHQRWNKLQLAIAEPQQNERVQAEGSTNQQVVAGTRLGARLGPLIDQIDAASTNYM